MSDNKKVSIKELKTFIEAVEFAADIENWIPSERQWKRIRSMIDALEEAAPAPISQPVPTYREPVYAQPAIMAPSGMAAPVRMPMAAPVHAGNLAGPFASENGMSNPVKTPNIDTTHGKPYTSSFA